jgi:hypothetical protein
MTLSVIVGLDSVVGLATSYGLEGRGIVFRWVETFGTYPDRPWADPAFYVMDARWFPG